MTLNAKIRVFINFLAILRDTFQERIAPKAIDIDVEKLRIKFVALSADFDGLSLDFLGSRKPAHEGIESGTPVKVATKWLEIRLTVCKQELIIGFCASRER